MPEQQFEESVTLSSGIEHYAPKGKTLSVTVTGIDSKTEKVGEYTSEKTFSKKKWRYTWIDKVIFYPDHVAIYRKDELVTAIRNGMGDIFVDVYDPNKKNSGNDKD